MEDLIPNQVVLSSNHRYCVGNGLRSSEPNPDELDKSLQNGFDMSVNSIINKCILNIISISN